MQFIGFAELQIDPKQRLAIPAKYRNQWNLERDGGAWVCIPWPTGLLRLYTEKMFEHLSKSGSLASDSLTPTADAAEVEAMLFGWAERLEMDSAGRVTLPKSHLELTRLGNEVVMVGARNRLEVRSRASWEADKLRNFQRLPELVQRIEAERRVGRGD
ncbi:MAG: hypothetical protein JNM07_13340 [Phycisphaerae bacterium]|nr:hypothetical protein [Phycisphaerae bacterium]